MVKLRSSINVILALAVVCTLGVFMGLGAAVAQEPPGGELPAFEEDAPNFTGPWVPANCSANEWDLYLAKSPVGPVHQGQCLNYTVRILNDNYPTACDVANVTVNFTQPAADGTPTGLSAYLIIDHYLPSNSTGNMTFTSANYSILHYCVNVTPGVTNITVNSYADGLLQDQFDDPTYRENSITSTVLWPEEACLEICKFGDDNGNAGWDLGERWLPGWEFHIISPGGYDEWRTTGPDGCILLEDIAPGPYTATETLKAGWYNTTALEQTVTVVLGEECARLEFGNREKPNEGPPGVPTMTHWGIVAMITLFAGLLVWTVRRRRLAS